MSGFTAQDARECTKKSQLYYVLTKIETIAKKSGSSLTIHSDRHPQVLDWEYIKHSLKERGFNVSMEVDPPSVLEEMEGAETLIILHISW